MKKDNLYQCVGENFIGDRIGGHCGEIKTLERWIEALYEATAEKAKEYFADFTTKEICEYLLKNKGERLALYSRKGGQR